jgi:demethylmenaquinone methyltransferase/2-methoxy-6-polyprenyl-1,4-benzoquinol methylase
MPQDKADTPEMFSEIAHRYDLLNHVLSLNIDRLWRKALVRSAEASGCDRILDAATGTADVAIAFANALPDCRVVGIDRSRRMLAVGNEKILRRRLEGRVQLREGDVMRLPFRDEEFDVVSIAFGLRNLPDYSNGVSEMTRVLKPGGRLLILEFSPPSRGLYSRVYGFYLRRIIPIVGGIVSGSRAGYRYLASSIGEFPTRDEVVALMRSAHLDDVGAKKLTGGIAYIYRGRRAETVVGAERKNVPGRLPGTCG